MSDEIAEFLRRAAQRRAQQAAQQANQQKPVAPPAVPQRPVAQLRPITQLRPSDTVVDAQIVDAQPVGPRQLRSSNVDAYVERHLNTQAFAERAERMADATEEADDRMDAHIHERFDHRLGQIGDSSQASMNSVVYKPDDEISARVVVNHPMLNLLTNIESIRSAMVVSEILLRRPEENW